MVYLILLALECRVRIVCVERGLGGSVGVFFICPVFVRKVRYVIYDALTGV